MIKQRSEPKNKAFFDKYASLLKSLFIVSIVAQLISAATEFGGIKLMAFDAVSKISPDLAGLVSLVVALLAVALIEIGLRVLLPKSVDVFLYSRLKESKLDRYISIIIILATILLLSISAKVSFDNSKVIVKNSIPDAKQESTGHIDSIYIDNINEIRNLAATEIVNIESYSTEEKNTIKASFNAKIDAKRQALIRLEKKEQTTGKSFISAKEKIKVEIAEIEAKKSEELRLATTRKVKAIQYIKDQAEAKEVAAKTEYDKEREAIKERNNDLISQVTNKEDKYGLGLAWLTIASLFLLFTYSIVERVIIKGSGIIETYEISQRDISPSFFKSAKEAILERIFNHSQIRIENFRSNTKSLPTFKAPAKLFDPTTGAREDISVKAEINSEEDKAIRVERRRKIGFKTSVPSSTLKTHKKHTEDTDNKEYNEAYKRLNQYRKRLATHKKKAKKFMSKGEPVPPRTQKAIDNNSLMVDHYEKILKNGKK
jgi:hypothetical protein